MVAHHSAVFLLSLFAETAADGEKKDWSPLDFDPGVMVWTWFVFGAVCLIVGKFIWTPLIQMLEQREAKIQGGLDEAERAREEARRIQAEFEQQVKDARAESRRMAEEARASAERIASTIETDAKARADQLLNRARDEIGLAQRQAQEELRTTAVDLGIKAAGAVIGENLDDEKNRKIATDVIASVRGG